MDIELKELIQCQIVFVYGITKTYPIAFILVLYIFKFEKKVILK